MLDALHPASRTFSDAIAAGQPVAEAWASCVQAAKDGAAATAGLRPRLGRASYLGERAVGVPDAGAVASVCWIEALTPFVR
jgi:dihydroxyacetone kinase